VNLRQQQVGALGQANGLDGGDFHLEFSSVNFFCPATE
jgi:hypothetical protein